MFGLLVCVILIVAAFFTFNKFVDKKTRANVGSLAKIAFGMIILLVVLMVFIGISSK
ncbi:hypothetical protein KP004_05705 [Geomonas oryzisoli]|uniref:DUF3976 domain-containing protein n=1 Tax=Geomonas oryzisoli TaxID=2847992 RepID=A0ABX8JDB8_9BACT|nr:hypothetical protein [Geomonas oryzisoli]QWV94674.1 hypothetical protein KP004_05705 [Geomonas oryzisoli]